MLRKIHNDADFFRNLISSARSSTMTVTSNGVKLEGAKLEASLASALESLLPQLNKLEIIIESNVIPDKYTSVIDGQTYYPSEEELKLKETRSLPQAKHSFFCIKNNKSDVLTNSHVKLIRDDGSHLISFFMEHKADRKYPSGGFAAKVKKGSLSESNDNPKYAIKIYKKEVFSGNSGHELRLAMRSAYCYKQLGREGYAFRRNNKQYMVTEWINGVNLDEVDQEQIQAMPIARRIVMAISLLRELNVLHKQGLIYHDIKPNNVMVNYGKLCFVDLDSVNPKHHKPLFGTTPMCTHSFLQTPQMVYDATYSNKVHLSLNEKTDLYAMGITLAHLFQEIYQPKLEKNTIPVNAGVIKTLEYYQYSLYRGSKCAEHPGLEKVLNNMVFQPNQNLVSCETYINALHEVLKTYPNYEQYLAEDRLVDLGKDVGPNNGELAFREIEVELYAFNQRADSVCKLRM